MNIIKRIGILCMLTLLLFTTAGHQKGIAQGGGNITFQTFYDELAPYGQWIVHPEYGSVWIPDVEANFQPYASRGHWVVTEFGNTWVSEYAWGWAPFHYGRWFYDDYNGWAWIPGNEWGPAWVAWRSGGGYYGWAPLGPGVNINVTINIPMNHWVFVRQVYITSPYIYRYCAPRPQIVHIYRNSVYIHNTYHHNNHVYVHGPYRHEIERVTHRSVPVYQIDNMRSPGRSTARNGSVAIYRPEVSSHSQSSPRGADHSTRANIQQNTGSEPYRRENYRTIPHTNDSYSGNDQRQPSTSRSNRTSPTWEERNRVSRSTTPNNVEYPTTRRESRSEPTIRQPSTESRRRDSEHIQQRSQMNREQRTSRGQASQRESSSPRTENERARRN